MGDRNPIEELSGDEHDAIREIERGLEEFHRAHGSLVAFHHEIGRAMERFSEAERLLRDGRGEIADEIRDEILPAGVTADGKLTYSLVAEFEDGLLSTVEEVSDTTFETLADGRRYPIERWEHDPGSNSP